jgi:S-formylglutathione hydrolase
VPGEADSWDFGVGAGFYLDATQTLALRHPGVFKTLSAFAPICAPTQCPWGHKAFSGYLGGGHGQRGRRMTPPRSWQRQPVRPYPGGILIDQGLADKFLAEQLHPHRFEAACHGRPAADAAPPRRL